MYFFKLPPLKRRLAVLGAALLLLLTACVTRGPDGSGNSGSRDSISDTSQVPDNDDVGRRPADKYEDFSIVTLLPRDAIPAIDDPQFLSSTEADSFYDPDELVIGVEFNGEARAYSIPFLSGHEIVNDVVGGVKIAVTW